MTEAIKAEYFLSLIDKMGSFLEETVTVDHDLGWLPENIEELMAKAALNVLETIEATNDYINNNVTSL